MQISIIVAAAENGVIGREGQLPWRLSADLRLFKQITMGHTIIMGRRTWESIGRVLPGRETVVVTRQADYHTEFPEVIIVPSLDRAIQVAESAHDNEAFVVGGAELYRMTLPRADRLYFTRINAKVEGDTFLPEIAWNEWRLIKSDPHAADEKNEHPFALEVYERC
jgi:dihydrofolate reductase